MNAHYLVIVTLDGQSAKTGVSQVFIKVSNDCKF